MAQVPKHRINFLPYKGGKFSALANLLPFIPVTKILHDGFCGGGSVSLNHPAKIKIMHDLDDRLINLYHAIQESFDDFIYILQDGSLPSYFSPHFDYQTVKNWGYQHVDLKAVSYFQYCWQSYNGGGTRWSSSVTKEMPDLDRLIPMLNIVFTRLKDAQIEQQSVFETAERLEQLYGPDDVTHYFDPPYLNAQRGAKDKRHKSPTALTRSQYRHDFTEADHLALVNLAVRLQGAVVISNYLGAPYTNLETQGFERYEFNARDLSGKDRIECIWLNEQALSLLHPKPIKAHQPFLDLTL